MKTLSLSIILLFLFQGVMAQNHYDIRLDFVAQTGKNQVCYEVQMAAADGIDLNLAGQNFRIYYDSDILEFNENQSSSLLPPLDYTDLKIIEEYTHIQAEGVGSLPYADNMTFLNFGMDLKNVQEGGITLPADGGWVKIAEVCFDVLDDQISNPQGDISLHWARKDLTWMYATAFVEVAEWVEPNKTVPAAARDYYDMDLVTSLQEHMWQELPSIYPNPTSGELLISLQTTDRVEIEVWSVSGQRILDRREMIGGAHPYLMDLTRLPDGAYKVVLVSGKKRFVQTVGKFRN